MKVLVLDRAAIWSSYSTKSKVSFFTLVSFSWLKVVAKAALWSASSKPRNSQYEVSGSTMS